MEKAPLPLRGLLGGKWIDGVLPIATLTASSARPALTCKTKTRLRSYLADDDRAFSGRSRNVAGCVVYKARREFPFRDGPLAAPVPPPLAAAPSSPRPWPYLWLAGLVSAVVPGIAVAAIAWHEVENPAAVDTSLSSIQYGQCIQNKPAPYVTISRLPVIPCSDMHWGQFLGLVSIGDPASTPYPGDAVSKQESYNACLKAFDDGVGSNSSGYTVWYSYPGEDAWDNDQWANAACVAEAADGTSFKGSLTQ
jgi:hypothetical protein